jgi:hypothetical protein
MRFRSHMKMEMRNPVTHDMRICSNLRIAGLRTLQASPGAVKDSFRGALADLMLSLSLGSPELPQLRPSD